MAMPGLRLKSFLPRSLYGRAAMIVFVPVLTILLVVALGFIQRHYEGVTRQMTTNFVLVTEHVVAEINAADDPAARGAVLAASLDLRIGLHESAPTASNADDLSWIDLSGRLAMRELRAGLPQLESIRLDNGTVSVWLRGEGGLVRLDFPISRISARNPHQMLVLTLVIGLGMGTIAFLYLKNQMRPMARLAAAAEAFGRGISLPLQPAGATEVRAAATAFLQMRQRIERHIEQRTLLLSGVSHDLRTPLTRMRLGLSLLEDEPEQRALLAEVAEMEALVDRFLDFARGSATEAVETTDLGALVEARVAQAARGGAPVAIKATSGPLVMQLRPQLMTRAVDNLISNALRYGGRALVAVRAEGDTLVVEVEDAGPGIREVDRERATQPFVRLDPARGAGAHAAGTGGSAGLGLAIVTEAMRSHGGRLELTQGMTPGYGGLLARLVVPKQAG